MIVKKRSRGPEVISPLAIALEKGYDEIALILARAGARCTFEEAAKLGKTYTDFISSFQEESTEIEVDVDMAPASQGVSPNPSPKPGNRPSSAQLHSLPIAMQLKNSRKRAGNKQKQKTKMKLWKANQVIMQQIKSLEDVELISKIAHGCDGVVFKCSALKFGIASVAVKILFNMGVNTSQVGHSFTNEFEILESLPFHMNIIPILHNLQKRPPPEFIQLFPDDLKQHVVHVDSGAMGKARFTTCIFMPIFDEFETFFRKKFPNLSLKEKMRFIGDIARGLVFLFDNDIVHRDMKLNNLLIDANRTVIISDFGNAAELSPDKTICIPPGGRLGGNQLHLAPEFREINTYILQTAIKVDYSKQPTFELGVLAFEIIFGVQPNLQQFGEQMDDAYFNSICPDESHAIPELFQWIRSMMAEDPANRSTLLDAVVQFKNVKNSI